MRSKVIVHELAHHRSVLITWWVVGMQNGIWNLSKIWTLVRQKKVWPWNVDSMGCVPSSSMLGARAYIHTCTCMYNVILYTVYFCVHNIVQLHIQEAPSRESWLERFHCKYNTTVTTWQLNRSCKDLSFKNDLFHFETTDSSNVPLVSTTQECIVLPETQQLLLTMSPIRTTSHLNGDVYSPLRVHFQNLMWWFIVTTLTYGM